MKALAAIAFSLVLAGCNNTEISRSAQWSVDHIAHASSRYGGWDFQEMKEAMRLRQQQWSYHNLYRWAEKPGWSGEGCEPSAMADPCRPRSGRGLAVMLAAEMNAPSLNRAQKRAYEKVGRAYGIDKHASTLLLEALNRAAVGDFGGLKKMGLRPEAIAAAHLNGGQLNLVAMEAVSRQLGIDPEKVESIIQSIYGQR